MTGRNLPANFVAAAAAAAAVPALHLQSQPPDALGQAPGDWDSLEWR